MAKYLALSLVFLLVPVAAQAQDEIIKDFGAPQVEKFIKDVIKADIKKNDMPNMIFYDTPDGQFDIYLRTGPKKTIFFKYPHQSLKRTQDQINTWNSGTHLTSAFLLNGQVVLQASLNLEAGLSMRQLADFYNQIQQERLEFEK